MNRRTLLTSLGLASMATIAACSSTATPGPASTPSVSRGPRKVTHRYGTTTVPGDPQRVVTLGQTDHDAAVALGVVPVAVSGFLGTTYSPFRPWNASFFGATKPPVLDMLEIPFEKVAALAPDLIVAVMSGVTDKDYAKLSEIAPTVAQPVDYEDWAVPYQPHTTLIGSALGQEAEAEQLVGDLDTAFATAKKDNTALTGKKTICAEWYDGAGFDVLGSAAPRSQFLVDIGMTLSPDLTKLVGKGYNTPLSTERLDLLDDLDVVLWTTDVEKVDTLMKQKLMQGLATTREDRYVMALNGGNDDLLYSMDWGSVLSNGWAIENAVPRFVKALDGDPATDPNA